MLRASDSKRSAAALRALSWTLLSAFVLAQLASFVHLVEARHVVCAVHGDLIEANSDAGDTAAAQAKDVSLVADKGTPAGSHHACEFDAYLHQGSRAEQSFQLPPPVPHVTPLPSLAPETDRHAAIALLDLAPKTSPPV